MVLTSSSQATPNQNINYDEKANQLAQDIDRLKKSYEQYFLGFEKMAPQPLRKQVDRNMRQILDDLHLIQNTATRFKVKSLQAKLLSYRRHWDRSIQQIEDGTFKRDRFRLKLKKMQEEEGKTMSSTKPASPPMQPSPETTKKNPGVESLLNQFVSAKEKCKEPTQGLNYESFAKTLSQQTQAIKKKFNCKTVRFKVVVENGKTKLKVTPVN